MGSSKAEKRKLDRKKRRPALSEPNHKFARSLAAGTPGSFPAPNRILDKWDLFARSQAEAAYHFNSQTISLYEATSHDLDWISSNPSYNGLKNVHGLLVHEFTHWLDHCSTVWGREHLIRVYNAFNAWALQREDQFHHVVTAFSAAYDAHLPGYYSTVNKKYPVLDPPERWKMQLSCGFAFDRNGMTNRTRPMVFSRFSNLQDELVCRAPMSVAALSECCAVAAEFEFDNSIRAVFPDEAHNVISSERKALQRLYTPHLAVYSVAAHCFAQYAKIYDAYTAYRRASQLARLCLNLPADVMTSLKIPADFERDWGEACGHLKASENRGFVFLVLAKFAGPYSRLSSNEWLGPTLQAAGLPTLVELERLVQEAILNPQMQRLDGPFAERLAGLLAVGARNYNRRGGLAGLPVELRDLNTKEGFEGLPVRLKNGQWKFVGRVPSEDSLKDTSPDDLISRTTLMFHGMMGFVDACARSPV